MADLASLSDKIKQLPLHAKVTFASRCARRVQPLTQVLPKADYHAIEGAIRAAEQFAKGEVNAIGSAAKAAAEAASHAAYAPYYAATNADHFAANAARAAAEAASHAAYAAYFANAANATAHAHADDHAALEADTYAANAAYAADAADARAVGTVILINALATDIDRLLALNLGKRGTKGQAIDPSEAGPLGPLWPEGKPEWYRNPPTSSKPTEPPQVPISQPDPALFIVWDPEVLSPDEYAQLVKSLGDLARAEGGAGVVRLRSRGFGVPCEAGVLR
jgi:hypothetical protein